MNPIPTDKQASKEVPLVRGLLDYFPDALAAVAHVSFVGNEQHNPGQPLHWAKHKSTDEADALVRHLIERGKLEFNGTVESAIRQCRKNTVYLVAVLNDLNATAREQIEGHVDVLKVDDKEVQGCLRVTLADGVNDASFLVDLLTWQR